MPEPTTTQIGYEDHVPVVEITLGNVEVDAPDNALFGKQPTVAKTEDNGLTTDYRIRSYYEGDGHRYMMGVTSPDGGAAIVQLSAKTLLWICDWTASKLGVHPTIPNPAPTSSKWVLLDDHYTPVSVMATNDGQFPLYRISGTYVYACTVSSSKTYDDVSFPIGAWLQDTFERVIKQEYITGTLLEAPSKQGAGGGGKTQGGAAGQYTRG